MNKINRYYSFYSEDGSLLNGAVLLTFDPLGRKTAVSISRASDVNGTTSQSFQYDGLSRRTFARDTSGSNVDVSFYFDSLSRVVEENQNSHYITQSTFTSQVATELTYPNDRQVTSGYDVLYRRNQVTETSTSDSITQWNFIGQRAVEVLLGNGLIQTMLNNKRTHGMVQTTVPNPAWGNANSDRLGFDGSSRMIAKRYLAGGINSMSHAYNDTTPVVGFTTQYDLSGNKMFERELHAETRSHLYQPFDSNGVPQGGYDSVNRLRKALRGELSDDSGYTATGGGSITTPISLPNTDTSRDYDLDGLGNWKQSDYVPVGGSATIDLRQHNKLNEIASRKVGDDTKVLFAYDGTTGASNGNLTDDGILVLSYDALNRLIQVKRKSDGATIGQYVYDALNRRVRKTISSGGLTGDVPNGTIDFLYQDWQVVEERNSSTTTKQYVWGQYIDECIQLKTLTTSGAQSLPAGDYYPLQDLLYRTIVLTNDDGKIVEAYDYDAYGNTLIFSAVGTGNDWWGDDTIQANYAGCEVLFCGYRFDAESKLYQVRNREYSPDLGRWLQRDPIGFKGGDENLYGYLRDNPVIMNDPVGLQARLVPVDPFDPNPDRPFMPFDPALLPPLPPYPALSPGACFWRSYPAYRGGKPYSFSPEKACKSANQRCGSHIKCGPCGPYNLPSFPKIPCDPSGAKKVADFLRKECGGSPGGDKLGHCWLACMASSCGGSVGAVAWKAIVEKDTDAADTVAENKGISCGCQTYRSFSKYASCMECCSDAVKGMIFK